MPFTALGNGWVVSQKKGTDTRKSLRKAKTENLAPLMKHESRTYDRSDHTFVHPWATGDLSETL